MADEGQRMIQVDSSRQLATSDAGSDIFMRIKNGNGKFVVDSFSGNAGNGIHSQGVVTDPKLLTGHDYRIAFTVGHG